MGNGIAGSMGMSASVNTSTNSRGVMSQPMVQAQPQSLGLVYSQRGVGGRLGAAAMAGVGGGYRSGGSSPVEGYVGYVTPTPMSAMYYQASVPLQMASHMHAVNALAPSMPVQSIALMEPQPTLPNGYYGAGKRPYVMSHDVLGMEGDLSAQGLMIMNGNRAATTTTSANGQERRSFYACPRCDKQFTLKGNLKRHQLTHQNHKPYICEICRKGFSRKADLEIHNRVHTGEKPYDCMEPGCGKKFARISDLRSHERTHR